MDLLNSESKKLILSIDGGGIRGIIPLVFLAALEKRLKKPCYEIFDFLTGSSTGGIIALALAIGVSAQEILNWYKYKSTTIFKQSIFRNLTFLFQAKYSAEGLESSLKEFFGDRLMQEAKVNVGVLVYNTSSGMPLFIFNNLLMVPKNTPFYGMPLLYMRDVAGATSAAPIFFEGKQMGGQIYWDGGIENNNPSEIAYILARKYLFQECREIKVLSVGTGRKSCVIQRPDALNPGILSTSTIVDAMFNGDSFMTDFSMEDRIGSKYLRIQEDTDGKVSSQLDNVSQKNLVDLEKFGEVLTNLNIDRVLNFL